jgi:hypothetical protein
MGGKRIPLCSNSKHRWVRRGKRDVCEVCGTKFPCSNKDCGHGDCADCRVIGIDQWTKENV